MDFPIKYGAFRLTFSLKPIQWWYILPFSHSLNVFFRSNGLWSTTATPSHSCHSWPVRLRPTAPPPPCRRRRPPAPVWPLRAAGRWRRRRPRRGRRGFKHRCWRTDELAKLVSGNQWVLRVLHIATIWTSLVSFQYFASNSSATRTWWVKNGCRIN